RTLPCGCDEPSSLWIAELRSESGATPVRHARSGEFVELRGGARLELCAAYLSSTRLWVARLGGDGDVVDYVGRNGHPIRYGYAAGEWPLADYQTVFATQPGSAEMPSAARPFSAELVARLAARGVLLAPLVLHTGVSSLERDEAPYAERFDVPA